MGAHWIPKLGETWRAPGTHRRYVNRAGPVRTRRPRPPSATWVASWSLTGTPPAFSAPMRDEFVTLPLRQNHHG